jgi:outer membrane lipoprotein-sorting protein
VRRAAVGIAVAVAVGSWGAERARAQTVEDVVRRYVEARGGAARLRAVQSLRLVGTLELPGVSAPFRMELKRPNKMRTEFTVEGHTAIRAFDGQTAWAQRPLPGEPPQPMSPEDAADARAQADVDLSPLIDAAAKGYSVELVGRDRVLGGETFKLIVRGRDGTTRILQIDTHSHLVVRTEDRRTVEGKPVDFVTEIGDYRPEGGLVFPHRMEVGPKDGTDRQRLVIDHVEINPPLDDSRFAMPPGRSAPAPGP